MPDLNICFLSGCIGRSGGTERVGTLIANGLADKNFNVYLLSFWDADQPFFALNQKVKLYNLINRKREGKLYRTYLYPIMKLHRFLVKNKIDVIIDIDLILIRFTAFATMFTKCKIISWEHFNYWNTLQDKKRIKALKLAKKFSSKIVVLTKADAKAHIEKGKVDARKVVQIYNPTPFTSRKRAGLTNHVFLAVGRLTSQKGFDIMLKIWRIAENKIQNWKLLIVGSGEDENILKEMVQKFNLCRVEFIPNTSEIAKYYLSSSCYLMTSRYEGFPMVLLEAQSFGLPVISYNCKTGPDEIIKNGVNGFIVRENDVSTFINSMKKIAESHDLLVKLSNGACSEISKYNTNVIVEKWERLIHEICI